MHTASALVSLESALRALEMVTLSNGSDTVDQR